MSVLLVDDDARFLEAARGLLEREGMTIVGVASTIAEALLRAEELHPDATLVDVELGEESGFDLARRLAEASGSGPRVILISTYLEQDLASCVDASPAVGFLTKARLCRAAIHEILAASPRRGEGGGPG